LVLSHADDDYLGDAAALDHHRVFLLSHTPEQIAETDSRLCGAQYMLHHLDAPIDGSID